MSPGAGWEGHLGMTAVVALLPFVAIAGTSFAKIAVVLQIVRSALGAPGVPPASVITALAVVMSMFVMAPVAGEIVDGVEAASALPAPAEDTLGVKRARALYEAGASPLLEFLERNTTREQIRHFADLAGEPAEEPGLRVLLPAFALSEIVEAFAIGVLLLLPFVVIDLIVGNALLSMGLHMTPPAAVSLPLKLLLFVAADGWSLLVDGLMVSYGM